MIPEPTESRENGVVWEGPLHFAADRPHLLVSNEGEPPIDRGEQGDPGGLPGIGGDSAGRMLPLVAGLLVGLVVAGMIGGAVYLGHLELPGWVSPDEDSESAAVADADLMSNEEQLETLLEDNDGRLKQQEVAERLGWTDAKTSKVVRQMREEDAIETFRIGRENVVVLPGTDIDESDS